MAMAAPALEGGTSLKALQTALLSRVLSLQDPSSAADPLSSSLGSLSLSGDSSASGNGGSSAEWKVLVYDRACQDILSPLLTVSELRRLGITLHLPLAATRERVPDVPAVYLVRATAENIRLIARDVRRGIYDSTHINFASSIPRALLENLAQEVMKPEEDGAAAGRAASSAAAVAAGAPASGPAAASRIARVLDTYADFVSLEDRLFTLNASDSFVRLHGAHSTPADEAAMFAHVDQMVEALFCVVATLGVVPVIRAKPGHAAEMVAQKLDQRLREHLASRQHLFSHGPASASGHRPLLILVDRTFDLSAPLLHSWTYQAMLHDLLAMQSNRVTVTLPDSSTTAADGAAKPAAAGAGSGAGKPKTYDLLASEDKFWKHHAGKPFPKVAEGVQQRLDAYQKEFNLVTRKAGSGDPAAAATGGMDDIAAAINSLPKLQKRKKLLDTHMNLATALLRQIKAREIDVFYDLEQSMLQRQPVDQKMFAAIFGAGGGSAGAEAAAGKGSFLDRLRFFLVYALHNPSVGEEEVKRFKALLAGSASNSAGEGAIAATDALLPELAALDYVQTFKFLNRLSAGEDLLSSAAAPKPSASSSSSSGGSSGGGGVLGNFSKLADSLYGGGVGQLLAGVRNLLPSNSHLPLTRLVESLMANKASASSGSGADAEAARYVYFDPKAPKAGRSAAAQRAAAAQQPQGAFKESIVFVLGGGSYSEYQNLQDWSRDSAAQGSGGGAPERNVVYGCSELVQPEQFVKQLAALHHASQQANRANVAVD